MSIGWFFLVFGEGKATKEKKICQFFGSFDLLKNYA